MKTNPNEAAGVIPALLDHNGNIVYGTDGLSKREYFAVLAMQSLLNSPKQYTKEQILIKSVEYADHLIVELNRESNE